MKKCSATKDLTAFKGEVRMLAESRFVKERLFYQTFGVIVFFRKKDGLSSLSGSTVSSALKGLFMDYYYCGVSVKAATDGD